MMGMVEKSDKAMKIQFGWSLWLKWVAATVGSLALAGELARRFFPMVIGFNVGMVVVTGIVVMSLAGVAQGLIWRLTGPAGVCKIGSKRQDAVFIRYGGYSEKPKVACF